MVFSKSNKFECTDTLILGAGLTGLSAAYYLGERALVVERNGEVGGSAASIKFKDCLLDRGVHALCFQDDTIRDWVEQELDVHLTDIKRKSAVWFNSRLIPFPLQYNLSHLPPLDRIRYLISLLAARLGKPAFPLASNELPQWFRHHFGKALTINFFSPYNEKMWNVPLEQLTTEWMNGYVPNPSATKIIAGLFGLNGHDYGNNSVFCYPTQGGISRLAIALAKNKQQIRLRAQLIKLDLNKRLANFSDGCVIQYRQLINTIPLVELVRLLHHAPDSLLYYAKKLRGAPLFISHLVFPQTKLRENFHWVYVPDPEYDFYRISFPVSFSSANCPSGKSVVTVEFSKEVINRKKAIRQIKDLLLRMGVLAEEESQKPVVACWDSQDYGYVTYDHQRTTALSNILSYLEYYGVFSVGRYGGWEYSNMESALYQGQKVAEQIAF